MKNIIFAIFAIGLQACTFSVPSYQVSLDNGKMLNALNEQVSVEYLPEGFTEADSIGCRAAGPVTVGEGKNFSSYIVDALKEELRAAGKLDEAGKKMKVTFTKIDFSSSMGNTNWYIDAVYNMSDKSIPISTVYHDRSSYAAVKACGNVAVYFRSAVQAHLSELYKNPIFRSEVGYVDSGDTKASNVEQRLIELKRLHDSGLLNDEEFKTKRSKIIESL